MFTNRIIHGDCIKIMKKYIPDNTFDFCLTDIPYDGVNRKSNGLRNLDKEKADIITFDLQDFLQQVLRVTKGSITIFCGFSQISTIFDFFKKQKGTVRILVWEKTNPSPMNGQYIYLSGVELAVWFKPRGWKIFNTHCKNTVFRHSCGNSKKHKTEKNHKLLKELILDNGKAGQTLFDPCCGSGAHCLVAKQNGLNYFGIELDENYFKIAKERIENHKIIKKHKLF